MPREELRGTASRGGEGVGRGVGRGLGSRSCVSSSQQGGWSRVSAAPGATCTVFEHLQCEHQLLARCLGVWTGQYQLLLVGAKGVAAAAEGVHLVGVHVETKESAKGTWSSLQPRGRIPIPAQSLQTRADPGRGLMAGPLWSTFPAFGGQLQGWLRGGKRSQLDLLDHPWEPLLGKVPPGSEPNSGWRLPDCQLTWLRRRRCPRSGSLSRWLCTPGT